MFNFAVFKQSVKKSWKLWTLITTILCFFAIMICVVAKQNPDFTLPGAPGSPISGTEATSQMRLIDVYSGAFYGMMGLILVIVYVAITGNKLVASELDRGELSYTLNTPTTRKEVVFTKAIFYIASVFLMALALSLVGSAFNEIISPGELDHVKFWLMNFSLFVYAFALSGIAFCASCWFNKVGNSLMFGLGLPIIFFLFSTIADFGSDMEFFKYLSLNTLFDTNAIASGESVLIELLILSGIGIVLYAIGIIKFSKKDLPL